jgi:hypothetical protein
MPLIQPPGQFVAALGTGSFAHCVKSTWVTLVAAMTGVKADPAEDNASSSATGIVRSRRHFDSTIWYFSPLAI